MKLPEILHLLITVQTLQLV